jgi:hypothetical protein
MIESKIYVLNLDVFKKDEINLLSIVNEYKID